MKFTEIISISGQSGLFKYVAQSKAGIIVESLSDARRFPVGGTTKVSSLADISIFTNDDDMPLGDVFQAIFDKNEGKESTDPKKLSSDELKDMMKSFIANYDEERVRISDMKKLFTWYNILVKVGITTFVDAEGEEGEDVAAKVAKAPVAAKPIQTAAPKVQATAKSKSSSKVRTIKAS